MHHLRRRVILSLFLSKEQSHFTLHQNGKLQPQHRLQKLIVIDFTASWCGLCQNIPPVINEFAGRYTDAEFIKINYDALDDVAEEFGVLAMPTFILIKQGKEVDKVVGVEGKELQEKIEKHRF